jgi:hypothetical protein
MNSDSVALFVSLSSFLTGISTSELAPAVDPNEPPLKNVYYDYANKDNAKTLQTLLDVYQKNIGQQPDAIANAIFNNPDPLVASLARSITLEWYLGSWYAPEALQKHTLPVPSLVISPTAYIGGWSWRVAQAHPMGYSYGSFGYWATPPQPLSAYLGTGS